MRGGGAGSGGPYGEGRIAGLSAEEARRAAEECGVPGYMARLSIFRVLLRHPRLARALNDLLGVMLFDGALDTRLRELIIMRVGWTTGSVYEWTQHWQIARSLGVADDDLLAVRDWRSSGVFGPAERAVLAAVDDVVERGAVSAGTWQSLQEHVPGAGMPVTGAPDTGTPSAGPDEQTTKILLEVVAVVGAWRMVSSWLESLEVPLEDGVQAWPPDGASPPRASDDAPSQP